MTPPPARSSYRRLLVAALFAAAVPAGGLHASETSIAPADLDFFERRIRPVLVERCYECHSAASKPVEGGLRLDSRNGLLTGGDSGPAVIAGDPDGSPLVQALRHEAVEMPPDGKLDDAVVADFAEWVRRGAPDPRADAAPAASPPSGTDHWAFRPVVRPAAPDVRDASWVRTPVDAFILSRLESAGLAPAPPADRATLLRRLSFDLRGLPPTPEEVEAFLADESPDAYERVVDRLLADPHYGERWGRRWLDYARYADSNGADENHAFPHAWRYRDWVVRAVNADLGYDAFLTQQLAGDLLPAPADEREAGDLLAATGLLVVGPKMLAEQDKDKMEADIVDEQIDTVSKMVLGLSLACARCHDHKFDPLPTEDYYAFAGLFASTRAMADRAFVSKWMERPLPSARIVAARAEAEAKVAAAKADLAAATGLSEEETARRKAEVEALEKAVPQFELVMAVEEGTPKDVPVHIRGNHLRPADAATPRGVPKILAERLPFAGVPADRSGRLELARWLTDPAHPLTARVAANRIWAGHFGEPLVRTPSDFGLRGEAPTHPELLDWLADEFARGGWSVKRLQRTIVLSNAYRMSSRAPAGQESDPDNRLLRRQNRRRLEAEPIRDSLLAASGALDPKLGGLVADTEAARRAIYLRIDRSALYGMFAAFDYATADAHLDRRPTTTVPQQALFLMNSPFAVRQAERLADSLLASPGGDGDRIGIAFLRLYGRHPASAETVRSLAFLDAAEAALSGTPEERRRSAWTSLCGALFAANEFAYVD